MASLTSLTVVDPLAFRERQLEAPLRPYEALLGSDWDGRRHATRIIEEGWRYSTLPRVKLETPIDWEELCSENRSWHFHLHSWDPLGPLLAAYDESADQDLLAFALEIAEDWLGSYPEIESGDSFAWYDMAVGIRAVRLGYLLDALIRTDAFDPDRIPLLLRGLELHRLALADDERFAVHSNHGIFQIAGQLAMGRRYGWAKGMTGALRQARGRLREMLERQFAPDGMHREHSPGYHEAVRTTLVQMIEYGLVEDAETRKLRGRIEEALSWFVDPMGELVTLGDTLPSIRPRANEGDHPHLRWVTSNLQEGTCPDAAVRAFDHGGYAVLRGHWPSNPQAGRPASYLAMTAAFHSRTHKHADDLSFVWYDRGRRLLIDPGSYGYLGRVDPESKLGQEGFWYSDPKRIYVESTRAHNALEIDGENYARRGVKPYGSALRRAGERGGIGYAEGQVRHGKSLLHSRLLLFAPGRWVLVLDSIGDSADTKHDFVQRFHFAPELPVESLGDQLAITVPREAERLYVAPLLGDAAPIEPVRGQEEPELLGWDSPANQTLVPCWTGGYAASGVKRHVFATLLAFGDAKPLVDPEANRTNATGRRVQVEWQVADRVERLEIDRTDALVLKHSIVEAPLQEDDDDT